MGCSSNPENNNDENKKKEIIETKEIIESSPPQKKDSNKLLTSKSTNILSTSLTKSTSSKKYINKKPKPYIISSIKSETNEIYILRVNASNFLEEYLIPIWFDKNIYIKFITKANWRIDRKYNYTNSNGMPSSHILGFNYGAAVARIGSGPNFLLVPNELTYFNKFEGPLYLRMNLPKNIEICPEGSMEVKIFDGTLMSIEEINSKIGWKEKSMSYSNKFSSEFENKLTTDINNLRMNPILFYDTFFKNNKNMIWTQTFLKNAKNNNDNLQISPFSSNNDLYNSLKEYVKLNINDIKKNINKKVIENYCQKLEEKIFIFLKNNFKCSSVVNCKRTKKNKSEEICIQYILDKNFRNNIFSSEYYSIAVNIINTGLLNEIFIILVLLKD